RAGVGVYAEVGVVGGTAQNQRVAAEFRQGIRGDAPAESDLAIAADVRYRREHIVAAESDVSGITGSIHAAIDEGAVVDESHRVRPYRLPPKVQRGVIGHTDVVGSAAERAWTAEYERSAD